MRGRPLLFTSYESEMAILPTWTRRIMFALLMLLVVLIPLQVIPGISFLGDGDWMRILSEVLIFAVAALGLHILSGLTGQVSLGHAFFMGVGAYTAAVLGGEVGRATIGFGLPMWIWLPAAGIVAALIGALVAPTAVRVRGIYLAIVTVGLVFIGEWMWRNLVDVTGGSQSGRRFPSLDFRLWKEEVPLISFSSDGPWFGIELSSEAKTYFFLLVVVILFALATKNIQRTRTGRSFMAIRDRDVAAEVMGVPEARSKAVSFAVSSFYAGIGGALLGAFVSRLIPESFNLLLSVEFLAILLVGGLGTVTGTLLGSIFVVTLPRLVQDFSSLLADTADSGSGIMSSIANVFVSTGPDDLGLISTAAGNSPGLNVSQFNLVLYGILLIVFLVFEPLGLYGIWIRIRNYWRGWPFTY